MTVFLLQSHKYTPVDKAFIEEKNTESSNPQAL